MIPSDIAAGLKLLTESSLLRGDAGNSVQQLARVRALQAQFPEFAPGQRISALIQRALPDGTFRALVAGREITLALPQLGAGADSREQSLINASTPQRIDPGRAGAAQAPLLKAGDTLELLVTESGPRVTFAQLAPQGAPAASSQPALSQTGRLISFLLTGQPEPRPALLAGGKPLLENAPQHGSQLAPALRQAVSQSGLFYESHQAKWLAGKLDLAQLMAEPQAQPATARGLGSPQAAMPGPSPFLPAGAGSAADIANPAGAPARPAGETGGRPGPTPADRDSEALRETGSTSQSRPPPPIPERLLPVVHQQLDALATQHYLWHGQAWPGQAIEWEIEHPERQASQEGDAGEESWNTCLRLRLPRLGGLEARIHLTPAGVAIRLIADERGTVDTLLAGQPDLESALAAMDIPVLGMAVERRREPG